MGEAENVCLEKDICQMELECKCIKNLFNTINNFKFNKTSVFSKECFIIQSE